MKLLPLKYCMNNFIALKFCQASESVEFVDILQVSVWIFSVKRVSTKRFLRLPW